MKMTNEPMQDTNHIMDSYYAEVLGMGDDEAAIKEYERHLEDVRIAFLEKTRIQGADLAFMFFAVMLQAARVYIIDKLTAIEKANAHGGREDKLHDIQNKLFSKYERGNNPQIRNLYASLDSIITLRGVPYDATKYSDPLVKAQNLFKGANHRFSALGHDPVLGMIIGPANILTSTITTINKGSAIPFIPKAPLSEGLGWPLATNHVRYDALLKNPVISGKVAAFPIDTVSMLNAASERIKNDKEAVAAAIIKHLIHIATDLYTPAGIQLPFANFVLDKKAIDSLTSYISTGDVIKVGASAGTAILINTIIAAVHGSKLLFEDTGKPFEADLYQARTRKIVTYSNLIVSSSNVLSSALSGDIKSLDIGGLLVTIWRLINDSRFIFKLEKEFIDSGVSEIYQEKYDQIKMYY